MRISDWSSDVCSSDLCPLGSSHPGSFQPERRPSRLLLWLPASPRLPQRLRKQHSPRLCHRNDRRSQHHRRSEEHTSELQSLMRISYAVFCLKKKKTINTTTTQLITTTHIHQ